MQTLNISQVKPGMTLALPINRSNFLIGKGALMTETLIERLRRAGVSTLYVA